MTYKRLAVLVCLLMLTSAMLGQSAVSINGTIKDPAGAVVTRATVSLIARDNSSRMQTISDGAGAYRFEHIVPGTYLLTASAPGFEVSATETVDATKSLQRDLQVRLSAVATTVSVTASGTAQMADELAKSVSIVDSQTMTLLDTSGVVDSLSYVPGLRIVQKGGPGGMVSIKTRGLRDQDTAILIDGFRFRDATAPQGDASSLLQDLMVTNTERIEVLRGTGSSIYGTDATGGVVNIITGTTGGAPRATILMEGGSESTFRGKANVSGGAFGDKLGYSLGIAHLNTASGLDGHLPARTSGLQGRFDYAVSRKTQITGRLLITDAFSFGTSSPQVLGTPGSGVLKAIPLSSSELRRYEDGTPIASLNIGNATYISDYDDPDTKRTARTYAGAFAISTHPTDALGLTASYQGLASHRGWTYGPLGAGYQSSATEIDGFDGTLHTISGRMDWRLGKHQSVNAGYEFEHENFSDSSVFSDASSNSSANVTQLNHSLFVQDQLHLLNDALQITGSYRAQLFSLNSPTLLPAANAPYAGTTFNAPAAANTWDASAAYLVRQTGTKIRGHVGTGYRAPSLYERFGSGYYQGYYSAYGDPELKPERTKAADAGIDQSFWNRKAQVSATYFYTRLDETIIFNYSIDGSTDPYGRYYGYTNTKGGIARGVEASLSLTPVRTLHLEAAYTFTNAREKTPTVVGVYQTFVTPDHMFSVLATENVTPRLSVVFGAMLQSSYLAPISSHAFRFDGLKRGQIGVSYRMPLSESRAVRLFANVDNAFSQSYYESGFRTPGTTARSGVQFEF